MKKFKIKKIYESKTSINGMLSKLTNIRNAIFYQNKESTKSLIDIFDYEFHEIDYTKLFNDSDKIYVIQTASNKFLEINEEDMEKFEI